MAAASAAGSFRDRDLPNLGADSADQNWISVLVFKFNLNLLASGDINGKVISPAYRSLVQVNTKLDTLIIIEATRLIIVVLIIYLLPPVILRRFFSI